MASLPSSESSSGAKRHSRVISASRTPLARRSTKGPLDVDDFPADEAQPPSQSTSATTTVEAINTPISTTLSSPKRTSAEAASVSPPPPPKDYSYLLRPEIYHPLSQLDLPPAFRTPNFQPRPSAPLPELRSHYNFRSAATAAALRLCTPPAPPPAELFSLLYTRLACLTLINHLTLAAEESKALQDISSPFYTDTATGESILPWELRVLTIRLQGIGYGDTRRAIGGYFDLAKGARTEAKRTTDLREKQLWKDRLQELAYFIANTLIETGDLSAAARHLESLRSKDPNENDALNTRLALLYISLGDVDTARNHLPPSSSPNTPSPLTPLLHLSTGDYNAAASSYRTLQQSQPLSDISTQNLAVCLFYTGQIDGSMQLLESLVSKGRSFHALTFNLCTVYELCTERARERKGELVGRVARGIEEGGGGGERGVGDFKL